MFKQVSFIKKVSHRVCSTVLMKDLAEIKFGILLREVLQNLSSFLIEISLMNEFLNNPYAKTQRHTLGMWSLPLLNDELALKPLNLDLCVQVLKKITKTKTRKE